MSHWSADLARKTYSIPHWADGYFDVDARGRIVVRPKGAEGPAIALPEVVAELGLARFAGPDGRVELWRATGCAHCAHTGYTGRVGITEIMPMTDPLRSLVMKHATSTDLRAQAVREGMLTMYEDGMRKAVKGVTTVEEVLRVTREG